MGWRGNDPSPVPPALVIARGAVHPLPSERANAGLGASARNYFFPLPWGEGGRGRRSGEGSFPDGSGQAPLRGQSVS